jgi:pimeloyl-ACP methyl ester carboxylesterase
VAAEAARRPAAARPTRRTLREDIAVPTLLIHAADDRLAPYEHVPPAAARIPGARLVTIDSGGHLFLRHAHEVRAASTAFIRHVLDASPPT